MLYKSYIPHAELTRHIKCYWSLETDAADDAPAKERIFPDGCIELIFHHGDLTKKYEKDFTTYLQPRSFVHGQIKEYIEIQATGKTQIFSVRFHPNGLHSFVPFQLQEITNQTISVKDIWKTEGSVLEEMILSASSDAARVAIIENFLLRKLKKNIYADHSINYCVDFITKNTGQIDIEKLSCKVNIGTRHLERKFIAAVGISMKTFSRITRFQNTLQLLEQKQFPSFTMLAYEGGFFDQAHFIKDFKEFTGLAPKQYFAEKLEMAKNFYSA